MRRATRGGMRLLLLASTLAGGAEASAAPGEAAHVELEWNAPPACPSRQAVLEEVTRTLGSARTVTGATRVRVDVTGEAPGHFVGTLRLTNDGAVHERRLEADTCAAVASAAALIMALAVEGVLPPPALPPSTPSPPLASAEATATTPAKPEPVAVAVPAAATTAKPAAPVEPVNPAEPSASWHSQLVVSAGALVDTATLPSPAFGPDLGVGWHLARRALRLGLSAQGAIFPSLFGGPAGDATAGEGGRFGLIEGAVRGCAAYGWKNLEIGPCLGVAGDHMSGSGRGSSVTLSGSGNWASAQGAALASYAITRWFALEAQVGASVPFARPTFVLESPTTTSAVHRPASVSGRTGIGLELRFF